MTGGTFRAAGSILLVGALVSRFTELALPGSASLLDSLFVLMLSFSGLASLKAPRRRRSKREQLIELLAVLVLVPSFFEAARHGLLGPSHGVVGDVVTASALSSLMVLIAEAIADRGRGSPPATNAS